MTGRSLMPWNFVSVSLAAAVAVVMVMVASTAVATAMTTSGGGLIITAVVAVTINITIVRAVRMTAALPLTTVSWRVRGQRPGSIHLGDKNSSAPKLNIQNLCNVFASRVLIQLVFAESGHIQLGVSESVNNQAWLFVAVVIEY